MDPMLRAPEVMERTGLSRTSLWRRVRAGRFPAPTELGPNAIGWPASVITAWLENRPRRTYGASTPYQLPPDSVGLSSQEIRERDASLRRRNYAGQKKGEGPLKLPELATVPKGE